MLCLPRENAISCVEAVAWGVCSQAGIQPSLGWGPGAPSPPWTLGLCTYYAHPRTSTAPGPPHLSSPLPLDLCTYWCFWLGLFIFCFSHSAYRCFNHLFDFSWVIDLKGSCLTLPPTYTDLTFCVGSCPSCWLEVHGERNSVWATLCPQNLGQCLVFRNGC